MINKLIRHSLGYKFIQSPNAVRLEDNRIYKKRKWMTEGHYNRLKKKWSKKYGQKAIPCIYKVGGEILVHPSLYLQMQDEIKRRETLSEKM